MRIWITLRAAPPIVLPLNYTYHLAGLIYHLLARSSQEYAAFLHGEGYGEGDRRFKLFTFSQLLGGQRRIEGDRLHLGSERVRWYITSPIDAFVLHLVDGMLGVGTVEVAGVPFTIAQIEALPEPEFAPEMQFTCLAPITMSVRSAGQRWAQYLAPEDPRFATAIRANLERKYALVHAHASGDRAPLTGEPFTFTFDPDYIARRGGRISKLMDYKGIKIRGYLAPSPSPVPQRCCRSAINTGSGTRIVRDLGWWRSLDRIRENDRWPWDHPSTLTPAIRSWILD